MPSVRKLLDEGVRYERSGALEKALRSYTSALEIATAEDEIAETLRHQADVFRTLCRWEEGLEAAQRSAAISRAANQPILYAEALNAEAGIHLSRGDLEAATALYQEMLSASPIPRIRGIALQNLGSIAARSRDLEAAEAYFRESHECFRRAGYARGEAIVLNNYSAVALDRGDYDLAESIGGAAMDAAQRVDDLELLAIAKLNYAEALAHLGRFYEAEEQASAAFGFFEATPNRWRQVRCLLLLGDVNVQQADHDTARRVYRRGLALAREIQAQREIEQLEERLREPLGAG